LWSRLSLQRGWAYACFHWREPSFRIPVQCVCDAIRFIFLMARRVDVAGYGTRVCLLSDVGKLMCNHPSSGERVGGVLVVCEHHIAPYRVGERVYSMRRLRGFLVRVDSHATEVVVQA
jgi:hypothetical protein